MSEIPGWVWVGGLAVVIGLLLLIAVLLALIFNRLGAIQQEVYGVFISLSDEMGRLPERVTGKLREIIEPAADPPAQEYVRDQPWMVRAAANTNEQEYDAPGAAYDRQPMNGHTFPELEKENPLAELARLIGQTDPFKQGGGQQPPNHEKGEGGE